MAFRTCLLALCLLAVTTEISGQRGKRFRDRLRDRRDRLEKVKETVPYFETTVEGTCEDVPNNNDDFSYGLKDICQDESEGTVICVCKPKRPCHQEDFDDDDDDDDEDFDDDDKDRLADLFSNPTQLVYEKKCKVCRDVGMRWTKCEEGKDDCPAAADEGAERCDRRRGGSSSGSRRRNDNGGRRDRRRDRRRNQDNSNNNRPSQLRSSGGGGGFA